MRLPGSDKETIGRHFGFQISRKALRWRLVHNSRLLFCIALLGIVSPLSVSAQSNAAISGRVLDSQGAVVPGAEIVATNIETGTERRTFSDNDGRYQFAALTLGTYRLKVSSRGFQTQVIEKLTLTVGQTLIQDFQLRVGDVSEVVTITIEPKLIEGSSISVGHTVNQRMVEESPLNGRYFLDLGLQVPGSVTASQTGFSTYPSRGVGALAVNTAGNREEMVNFMINGVTLNNLVFSSITFQPAIDTIREFRVDNSTFSAQYGQNSGAVVDIATRSGTNRFHGQLFEFLRNDALDARNYFSFTSARPPPFKRNQFGGNIGGPISSSKLFFFFSYEGLRQSQQLDLNSLVLSDSQRASATDPVIQKLIPLIPRANFTDSSGAPRFIGSANAPVNIDQYSIDLNFNLTSRDVLHGYYAVNDTYVGEPNRFGNTIPGFGHDFYALRQIFTLNETRTISALMTNELTLGFNRNHSRNTPSTQLNPADFGINAGRTTPVGLPQISVAGGTLNFGGPSAFPSGRADTTFVIADHLIKLSGAHSLKFGGEFRKFFTNAFRLGTGSFSFPTVTAFLANNANSFSVTLGNQTSSISESALGFFIEDSYRWRSNLTLDLGFRYDWNVTPTERFDRFIVFDPQTVALRRAGVDFDQVYHQNNKNFQPRLGFAWDPFKDGKTSVRAAYAILVDQPMTSVVTALAANPPLALPLTFSGPIRLDNALTLAQAAGLAPQTVDPNFDNSYLQSWNLNVQRELAAGLAVSAGYVGSKATHLILRRNLNQPVNGVRPYSALSASSPILPGTPLGNITQTEASGASQYNALWFSVKQQPWHGLQYTAFYTWSRSIDYNSLSSQGIVVQNSYDVHNDRALSDFDARHRFVLSAIYDLPLHANGLVDGWQFGVIAQWQSGSPVNIVTTNSTVNGVPLTLRPDVTDAPVILGQVERWFDTSVFAAVPRFGTAGRNLITGPTFNNIDCSVIKNIKVRDVARVQLRAEIFDLFNHPNFGQPGNVVDTQSFGQITNTRFATGESGSSRQIQFALKIII